MRGVVYDLSHLDPFVHEVVVDGEAFRVRVTFTSHVFTEKLEARHTPDLRYSFANEVRAFDVRRHQLSLALPGLLRTHGNRSVYHSDRGTFFLLKGVPNAPGNRPYAVFFAALKSNRNDADVAITVRSAYEKDRIALQAQPVKLTRLVKAIADEVPVPAGPPARIQRR